MKISQREARRLKKRVAQLEAVLRRERSKYSNEYVGTEVTTILLADDGRIHALRLARRLELRALPHPDMPV